VAGAAVASAAAVSCDAAPVTATEVAAVASAQAGLEASIVAMASGLAAATNRERLVKVIIEFAPSNRPQRRARTCKGQKPLSQA
jgi:hypothetical protein